jgi:predicted secreted protein
MATPRAAIGTLLQRNGTTVALVSDIEGLNLKGDTIDVTNHNNPNNYKEFIVGLKEGGDVKAKIFYDPLDATHTGLFTAFDGRTLDAWTIVPPVAGTPTWGFTGVLTQFDTKYKVNGAIEADITIKCSGAPTYV